MLFPPWNVLDIGTQHVASQSEKRNVRIANFISLIFGAAILFIVLFRGEVHGLSNWFMIPLLVEVFLTLVPFLLNHLGKTTASRIFICWVPFILLVYNFRLLVLHNPETSEYVGARVFQIVFACFPFLIFSVADWGKVLLGLSVPFVVTLGFDTIMAWSVAGYLDTGLHDSSYSANLFRTGISFFILGSAFLFLKSMLETEERANVALINTLRKKNEIIRQHADREQRRSNFLLSERIKELSTLYRVSQMLSSENKPIDEVFQELPALLPAGWQYPDACGARLTLFGKVYTTDNFCETEFLQTEMLAIDQVTIGKLDVGYVRPIAVNGSTPFLQEEKDLLQAVAEMVKSYIVRKQGESELNQTQANLSAIINNTEIMIWSVDRNMKLLTFNEPFRRYNKRTYKIDVQPGNLLTDLWSREVQSRWHGRYERVLAGEDMVTEETLHGIDFRFSLHPIVEHGHVIGVSAFGDNITEQNVRKRSLAEADKKISELKVMALKSVMNPHFVFNVLNSIQFFIASNDRDSALSYLSTFSKLMRSVLDHSVKDSTTLDEEVNLLKNYVTLEKLRFNDKFDFILEIDDDIVLEDTSIPSLLIQPYIENAILHGFHTIKKGGLITLRMKKNDEYLVVEIEDNGIGREAAERLRKQSRPGHESIGTKLTEERLRLINEQAGTAITVTDLHDGAKARGTIVSLNIKSS